MNLPGKKSNRRSRITNKIQSKHSLKYRLKTQKDYKSLQKTSPVYRFYQKLHKTPGIMANCNPVVPAMDCTEDTELHKRYIEWKEEVELELGSSLSNRSNSVKSNYVLRWAGKPARDYLKSLPESEFKYGGASAEARLTALEEKTKPKSNKIVAFTKLHCLKLGNMPLSERPENWQSYATTQMTRTG